MWKTGYLYTGGFGGLSVSSAPYADYTHIVVSYISPNADGSINTSALSLSELSTAVTLAHTAGAKILIGVGGDGGPWSSATSSGTRATFIANLASFITAHNLDGVDLDWEASINDAQYGAFMQGLRSYLGSSKTITIAAYGGSSSSPLASVLVAGHSVLDQVNMMTYDLDIYEGQTWFETATRKGPDNRASIERYYEEFTGAGIPASKLGFGIPFYGSKYNSASGPNQSRSYAGFIPYSDINPAGAVLDSTYKGTGVGSNPWTTFVGTAQIAAIVSYGAGLGVGGYMGFPLNWEDSSHTLSGALNTAVGGGSSPSLPSIYSFSANTTSVVSGGAVTFTWSVGNATSLSINGTTVTGTSHTFYPVAATDYVLRATNADGYRDSATIHISIGSGAPSISSFTADPANFVSGQEVTLRWTQSLGTSATIDNGVGTVTGLSSKVVVPSGTTTYKLTVSNSSGSVDRSVTVTLGGAPPVIQSLTATDTSIAPGDPVTISFSVLGAGPGTGTITLNGVPVPGNSVLVAPLASTKYILAVSNNDGFDARSITIDVVGPSPNNLRIWQIRDGDKHGSDDYFQISDNTGEEDHFGKFKLDGTLTNSHIKASDVLTAPGGGTGLTSGGYGSPYEQIPNGAKNGSNLHFYLDYIPVSPPTGTPPVVPFWLFLNGAGQSPYTPLYTLAPGSNHLVMKAAPKATDEFWCVYFRGGEAPMLPAATSAVVHVVYSYIPGTGGGNVGIVQLSDPAYFAQIYDANPYTLRDKTVSYGSIPAGFGEGGWPMNLELFQSMFFDSTDVLKVYDVYADVTYSDASTAIIRPTVEAYDGGLSLFDSSVFWLHITHAEGDGTQITYTFHQDYRSPVDSTAVGQHLKVVGFTNPDFNIAPSTLRVAAVGSGTFTVLKPVTGSEDLVSPSGSWNGWIYAGDYDGKVENPDLAVDGDPATYATLTRYHYYPGHSGGGITFTF